MCGTNFQEIYKVIKNSYTSILGPWERAKYSIFNWFFRESSINQSSFSYLYSYPNWFLLKVIKLVQKCLFEEEEKIQAYAPRWIHKCLIIWFREKYQSWQLNVGDNFFYFLFLNFAPNWSLVFLWIYKTVGAYEKSLDQGITCSN